ncbi:MAG: EAL domain-containing protein [Thermoleophilia bacterium]
MERPERMRAQARIEALPSVTSCVAIAIGTLVFVAWLLGLEDVKRLVPGLPQMKAYTALALVSLGAAVLLLREGQRGRRQRAGRAVALVVGLFGAVVVAQYLTGPLGIDELLFEDPGPSPGRPAPHTAVALVFLGGALAVLDSEFRGLRLSTWLLAAAAGVVFSALLGYAYEVDFLRATSGTTGVAIHTVLGLAALVVGVACLRPERGPVAFLRRQDTGAAMARRLLPAVVGLPVVFGFARLQSEALGLDPAVGVALNALATMAVFLAIVLSVTTRLSRSDAERVRAAAATGEALTRYRALLEATPDPTIVVDGAGQIVHANRVAEQTFGYEPGELAGAPVEWLLPERLRALHRRHRALFGDHPYARRMGGGRELFACRKDGSELPVEISLSPVVQAATPLVIAAIRDVTQRRHAEARLREAAHFFEMSHDLLCTATLDGTFLELNGAWQTILGWSAEELRSRPFVEFVHPDDVEPTMRETAQLAAGAVTAQFTNRYRTRAGDWRWLEWNATGVVGEGLIYASARDITGRVRADEARRQAEEQFTQAFLHAPIGMALTALDGSFISVNPALCELTGYSADQLRATSVQAISHEEDAAGELEARRRMLADAAGRYNGEARFISSAGAPIPVDLSMTLVSSAPGRPSHFVLQVVDMSERKRFEEQLQFLADHDPLTGLLNRRRFSSELNRELALAVRYGSRGALLALDLDHFKYVNDTLGHSVGDDLITRIAGVVRRRLRATDVFARLGGDEFAVLLAHVDEEEAMLVAADLLGAIRREGQIEGGSRVTASLGVAMFDGPAEVTAEELMIEADIAMYEAKEAGRDRAAVFDAAKGRRERMHARVTWADRIHSALENDGFVLHAQPILSLSGDSVARYELLIRMRGENGDLIPPSAFLDVAERFELIQQIDRWVLGEAIRLIAEQQRAGQDVRLEMNLSAKSVIDPTLPDLIAAQLQASGADPGRLCFEITETAAIVNIERAQVFARRVRELGCTFALDDFGSGFASFYYLKRLEFDYLKIDGEFIRGLPQSHINQLVVASLVQIASGLGKHTIAEFVGDEQTVELLRRYGVDYAQGFHIAEPGPIAGHQPGPAAALGPAAPANG